MAPFPATCSVVLPMSAVEYLQERNKAAFRTLLSEVLDLGSTEEVASWDEGDIHYQEIITQPDYSRWVPKLARRYVKPEDICFSDVAQYDPRLLEKSPYRLPITSTVPLLANKMECERVNVVDAVDPCSCRLSVEGHIIVRLFGIGRLAERIIIESTHKTLRALPAIIERYNEMRKEFDMDEPLDDSFTLSRVTIIVQRPYLEEVSFEETTSEAESVSSTEDNLLSDEDYEQPCEQTDWSCSTALELSRSETKYFDAEEDQAWLDPVWAAALEEVSVCLEGDTKVTIRAVNKDERRALLRIKRLSASRVTAVILSPHKPGSQAASMHLRTRTGTMDTSDRRWHRFWRKVKPARAPVPSFTARAVHLLHLGAAVGWVKLHSRKGSEDAAHSSASGEALERTRPGPGQLTRSLLVKLHLRKGGAVRVTTPPAPPGTRYDVDLDHPSLGAVREDELFTATPT